MDDVQGDDFTGGLLQLAELGQEVPEAGLCDHGVGCKDAHAIELWGGVVVGGEAAADDLVFCEATWKCGVSVGRVGWVRFVSRHWVFACYTTVLLFYDSSFMLYPPLFPFSKRTFLLRRLVACHLSQLRSFISISFRDKIGRRGRDAIRLTHLQHVSIVNQSKWILHTLTGLIDLNSWSSVWWSLNVADNNGLD